MALPQKIKNRVIIQCSNPSSGYLPEKLENIYSQRYVHPHVHCSVIHGGQGRETTELWYLYTWVGISKFTIVIQINNAIIIMNLLLPTPVKQCDHFWKLTFLANSNMNILHSQYFPKVINREVVESTRHFRLLGGSTVCTQLWGLPASTCHSFGWNLL